jgi:hypothetical protein
MAGWNADTAAGPLGAGTVTLVEGSSFCISSDNGDLQPEYPRGVFFEDTRILSRWALTINGQPLEPLAAMTKEPYRGHFVGRVRRSDGYADSPLIVERLREVGAGILEQITVRNYSPAPAECVVSLKVEADFADLFEVKEARIQQVLAFRHHRNPIGHFEGTAALREIQHDRYTRRAKGRSDARLRCSRRSKQAGRGLKQGAYSAEVPSLSADAICFKVLRHGVGGFVPPCCEGLLAQWLKHAVQDPLDRVIRGVPDALARGRAAGAHPGV